MHKCCVPGCTNETVANKWADIQSAWFFMKDGSAYCPEHIPDWVADWRRNKELMKGEEDERGRRVPGVVEQFIGERDI